jgi:predicted kinase
MSTPLFLILVDGPMGSGKTTTTKLLNEKLLGTARVAFPDIKRLIPNYKEGEKSLSVTREVMRVMIDKYLELGVSVIVEQVSKAEGVQVLKGLAEQHGAVFFAYRLDAPKNIRFDRVCDRTKEMMDVSELPGPKKDELTGYFEPNDQFYSENPSGLVVIIETQNRNPEEVAELVISKLS